MAAGVRSLREGSRRRQRREKQHVGAQPQQRAVGELEGALGGRDLVEAAVLLHPHQVLVARGAKAGVAARLARAPR